MTVVDSSVLVDAYAVDTMLGTRCRDALRETRQLHAPAGMPAEFQSGIRGLLRGEHIDVQRAERAMAAFAETRVKLHPFARYAARVWTLRDNATTYDAWYVAVAERLGATLLTTDHKYSGIPKLRCQIIQLTG